PTWLPGALPSHSGTCWPPLRFAAVPARGACRVECLSFVNMLIVSGIESPMNEQDWLAEQFERKRSRLRAVAYRMLGSLSDADDAVQESWLRLSRSDARAIENLTGWLTTVVARVSLNMLRSRKLRREESLDVHVPDPIVSRADEGLDPEHAALLSD